MTSLLLVMARGLFVLCALSAFGAALFAQALMKPVMQGLGADARGTIGTRVRAVTRLSLVAALPASVVWLGLEAKAISGAKTLAEALGAVPDVLLDTSFGHVLALQAACLAGALAAIILVPRRGLVSAGLAGLASLLEAAHGHGFAMGDPALAVSQGLHLLASGAWLGALVPLCILVREAPAPPAERAARRFATLGTISVAVLAATAAYQGFVLGGGLPGLTATAYGAVLLTKAGLFGLLLALAAVNRWRLTPALGGDDPRHARAALQASITVEAGLGLLVVLAASTLSQLEPGMHMTH